MRSVALFKASASVPTVDFYSLEVTDERAANVCSCHEVLKHLVLNLFLCRSVIRCAHVHVVQSWVSRSRGGLFVVAHGEVL